MADKMMWVIVIAALLFVTGALSFNNGQLTFSAVNVGGTGGSGPYRGAVVRVS